MMRWATRAELVAGLLTTGIPARRAQAAFSARPQAGKLNALMWTATPWRGTWRCCPWKRGRAPEGNALAVHEDLRLAQGLAELGVGREREDGAVHVELGVPAGVAAARDREVEQLVAVGGERVGTWPSASRPAPRRSWRGAPALPWRARRPSPPRGRYPAAATVPSGSSVAGFLSVSARPVPETHSPPHVALQGDHGEVPEVSGRAPSG